MAKRCFLRESKIELADGCVYTFRAMPFSEDSIALFELLTGEGKGPEGAALMRVLRKAIVESLSWDQEPEVVEELFACGLIPLSVTDGGELFQRIMGALASQMLKAEG